LPWARPHLAFDPGGPPLFTLGYNCKPVSILLQFLWYLTEREIEKLIKAAGENRWGHRDATAILIAYRHGLRASEIVALRWDDIDFQTGKLHA
jgi:integrase